MELSADDAVHKGQTVRSTRTRWRAPFNQSTSEEIRLSQWDLARAAFFMIDKQAEVEVLAVKDGSKELPVPSAWRPVFCAIVAAFIAHDYLLKNSIPGVEPVSVETADQIGQYIADYGATLVALPAETWDSAVCMWNGDHWDVLVDLWTREEGQSDLVLSARVTEGRLGPAVKIHLVYVP